MVDISLFLFRKFGSLVKNYYISSQKQEFLEEYQPLNLIYYG